MLNQAIESRIDALLAQMTLEEKTGQLNQIPIREGYTVEDDIRAGKVGSVIIANSAFAGNDRQERVQAARLNALQQIALEESRLRIPLIFGRDVIHGHRTVAPIPLGQAASWSPELIRQAAENAAREAAADGIHWTFTPMLDIARDPRWGRVAEGFGEDPYLCGRLAAAAIHGYQGDDLSHPERLAACAKHFVGYGAAEGGRDYNTAEIGENTLRNLYLPSFHAAVKAGVATLMSSFNEISGVPVSGNRHLLTEILRGEWGFDGYVVSDWGSVWELISHGVAADRAEAARKALDAGVDMDMCTQSYPGELPALVRDGVVSEAILDEAVRRVLRIKLRRGIFEHPYTDTALANTVMLRPDHVAAARALACKSLVLLKNDRQILPLAKTQTTIGLFGPLTEVQGTLFGCWTLDGQEEDVVTVLAGMQAKLGEGARIVKAGLVDDALKCVRQCDVVVAVVGESAGRSGEDNSTTTIDLPPGQLEFLQALHAMGKPLVVVVIGGRPLNLSWVQQHAQAVLMVFHPGVQGGNAIADVLFGDENPGGKLPITFPRNTGQIPLYYNHKATGKPMPWDACHSRYTDSLDSPLYPFGYGLSYTTFAYANLQVAPARIPVTGQATVTCEVTNTGDRAGDEIVQLYIRDIAASASRPVRELKGFNRLTLQPGETQTVSFTLGPDELGFYNLASTWAVEPGEFRLWVAPNSTEGLEGMLVVE